MHAVAAGWHGEVARPEWMFARAQPHSRASRSTRGVDARPADRQNDPVPPPRPAPGRHQATSAEASHSDQLIRLLYAEHAGPLLMFVMRLTGGDRQRAEDIVQETLLRAWRNAHRLGGPGQGSLRPWLVTVARRIAIDEHRSEQARPAETYDRDLTAFAESDSTDRVLRTMTVADALRTLSQSHREILVATYFRGRTVPEAAEELGLPLGTAKSRVYYALRALRTALQERGVTE
ncbi:MULTISPECIES: sigma-70 family RNA polymerase sigma factor [Micromonospora]|uniref:RNA polymerase sigma-70 factor, ECF subfamily n=1 Tax=Micromonospora humi TaxID=745366 RepID=A0A1C5K3K9_9ACTN|nr:MULTISPECIES: sigma-70 family RNA polymerase sigma factor [Micromonospora]MCZ7438940.1 sigma-70 family RNA polymerase sigma factor [Micromonospora sp. WMMC241]MDG4802102.1 sigma-70 family RNA polymerase sigma factor [Micromonospora sp. WMMD980]SCG77109.1 RNA polymerase sigma-70 factor, ECF subfamily [Micromonospora humi]